MLKGVIGYKIPSYFPKFEKKMIDLVLKNAQEQELCEGGSKVMVFLCKNESEPGEMIEFDIRTIPGEEEEEGEEEEVMSGDQTAGGTTE